MTPLGTLPAIIWGTNGRRSKPAPKITSPTILYIFLYSPSSAQTVSSSFSATGLYILYVIAVPNPRSARLKIRSTELNRLLSPRYSAPRV